MGDRRMARSGAASEDIPTFHVRVADTVEFGLRLDAEDSGGKRLG